jgi:type VI secretion system secreted protein Hcp
MAQQQFIKFDGVDGEATHKDHKGEIEVLAWSWGLSVDIVRGLGSGAAASRPKPAEFTFHHVYDKASPVLATSAVAGKHFKEVVLSARKAGAGQKDFLKVTLEDVLISRVQHGGDGQQITEEVALVPRGVSYEYRQATAKGTLGPPIKFDWDITSGKT